MHSGWQRLRAYWKKPMSKIFQSWSNLLLLPIVLILLVILGVIGEVSKWVHELTGFPFFTSVMLAVMFLFVLILAAVSAYRFLRSFLIYLIKRRIPRADNDSPLN